MKAFIIYLLLGLLLGIMLPLSFAQQNQTISTSNIEVEALKKQILILQNQLQTVENEKLEVVRKLLDAQSKLADANVGLMNAEFGRLERDLRDSNHKWLTGWILFFLAILAAIGRALWLQFKSKTDQLVEDEVEKSLSGFKETVAQVDTLKNELQEAVGQVNILRDQIRILEKEHASSVLEEAMSYRPEGYSEQVKALPEQAILDVFSDETRRLTLKYKAAEVLTYRKSTQLISPMLEFLNSVVDSDLYNDMGFQTKSILPALVSFLSEIRTQETYDGLKEFLNRLLTKDPKHKDLFLTWTAFSLAYVSGELDRDDSVSIIRKTIPDLNVFSQDERALKNLVEYFDIFNEPEGIKEILTYHAADIIPDVETRCLDLLQNHDPDFVNKWRLQKATINAETEES